MSVGAWRKGCEERGVVVVVGIVGYKNASKSFEAFGGMIGYGAIELFDRNFFDSHVV